MSAAAFPIHPEEITTEWLTEALREEGALREGVVARCAPEPLGGGQGLLSQMARVQVEYDGAAEGAPATLIAKFPSAHAGNRDYAARLGLYLGEVRFYQEMAPRVALRTPRCYHADYEEETGDFILLLEDLSPGRCGDQVVGCSPAEAETAVRAIAGFHATWWERPELAAFDWMPALDRLVDVYHQRYRQAWPRFLEREGDRLPREVRRLGEHMERYFDLGWHRLSQSPCTAIHADFRLDNLFFPPLPGGAPFAVVDWQGTRRAHGMFDVGYFLCESLSPADRRAEEDELLAAYHATLLDGGVRGYDAARCREDYRLSMLVTLSRIVIVSTTMDTENERGQLLVERALERLFAAVLELQVEDLLPE
jgi:hypothetical protein